jgi:DNA polymerase-3 subunit delta
MLYVFHGEDEFTRSEELAKLRHKIGDAASVSLNTTTFSGRDVTLGALILACDSLPFVAERRLVVVQDYWSRFEPLKERKPKERQTKISAADAAFIQGLADYLPRMPETTRLVFLEGRTLTDANPVFAALPSDRKRIFYKAFAAPEGAALVRWIEQRVASKGGTIHPVAAQELARLVGSELRQLEQEIEKLLAHANYERMVNVTDVEDLVHAARTANVFALVDALGMRQASKAVRHLHELLEGGAAPLYLLSMIERQFRILLQVKGLREQRASIGEMQKALGMREFIIEKSVRQAQHFSMTRLQAIYAHLAEVELAIKSGEITEVLALDMLAVELCA